MMKPTAALIAAATLAAACTDPAQVGVAGVRAATPAEVAACTYVMDLRMKPSVYGALAQPALEYARRQILLEARDGGANAVVFQPVEPGELVTEIRATAYRC